MNAHVTAIVVLMLTVTTRHYVPGRRTSATAASVTVQQDKNWSTKTVCVLGLVGKKKSLEASREQNEKIYSIVVLESPHRETRHHHAHLHDPQPPSSSSDVLGAPLAKTSSSPTAAENSTTQR
jgi:hypothetical protein